jgi:hypothetical protein
MKKKKGSKTPRFGLKQYIKLLDLKGKIQSSVLYFPNMSCQLEIPEWEIEYVRLGTQGRGQGYR